MTGYPLPLTHSARRHLPPANLHSQFASLSLSVIVRSALSPNAFLHSPTTCTVEMEEKENVSQNFQILSILVSEHCLFSLQRTLEKINRKKIAPPPISVSGDANARAELGAKEDAMIAILIVCVAVSCSILIVAFA